MARKTNAKRRHTKTAQQTAFKLLTFLKLKEKNQRKKKKKTKLEKRKKKVKLSKAAAHSA